MTTKESDWFGACIISGVAGVVLAAFLWATSSRVEQLPIVWGRCWAKSLLLAVAFWAFAFYSRRRRLGLGACCELGILLLVGFLAPATAVDSLYKFQIRGAKSSWKNAHMISAQKDIDGGNLNGFLSEMNVLINPGPYMTDYYKLAAQTLKLRMQNFQTARDYLQKR